MKSPFDVLDSYIKTKATKLGLEVERDGRGCWRVAITRAGNAPDTAAHTLILHFDGSCWPNPGGRMGYGFTLAWADGRPVYKEGGTVKATPATNNVAEWYALTAGVEYAQAAIVGGLNAGRLVIRGDSNLVVSQLNCQMKCKKAWLVKYRDRCRFLLKRLGCEWEAAWLPRAENTECDALAA